MKKLAFVAVLSVLLLGSFGKATAQSEVSHAEAMFIYNFTRFIEWPAQAKTGNFVIYVYGSANVYNDLKSYTKDKLVGTQSITITRVNSPDEVSHCNLLFVANTKTRQLAALKSKLKGSNTLIITEKEGALSEGSAINFVLNGNKLGYEIKPVNASDAGLKLNSMIIDYARNKS